MPRKIYLANPRGFCAGVDRAMAIVNRALEKYGAPIYVRHEVVHNKMVVNELREKGAVFVDEVDEVPEGAIVVFSAHGVAKQVFKDARDRDLQVFDATCPLVTKVHLEVVKFAGQKRETVLIGHEGHPEVEGTMGQYDGDETSIYLVESVEDVSGLEVKDPDHLSYVTQTTLSVDDTREIVMALQSRYPGIRGPHKEDICYATQNRQDAVKQLAEHCDLILVVGSQNSSNSNRLRELAIRLGCQSYLIDDETEIRESWLEGVQHIGVTSGASAPELLVQRVIGRLNELGGEFCQEIGSVVESVEFALPRALREPE